ncbi:MAG: MFS transporter [Gammaproteobacteria bacterium]|nr:MFS transporter [Gammaproteobacteria bacterium]
MTARSAKAATWAIFAVFFAESMVLGNWITRIPDIKAKLGLTDTQLGLSILAIPMGTLAAFAMASKILAGSGLRQGCRLWLPLWAVFFLLPGLVNSGLMLFLTLLISGFAVGMCEVAMNTKADEIERTYDLRIMSRCHGFWSLGSMAGALLASSMAQMQVVVSTHYLMVMPLLAIGGYLASTALPDDQPDADSQERKKADSIFSLPSRAILLLCLLPVGIMTVEGAFIDWSAVFMNSVLNASPIVIGITYAFFSVVMAVTRLSGDFLASRLGSEFIVRWSGVAATAGIGIFALAGNNVVAFIGATLAGLGVAIVYPLAMTAAARRPGRATENVAAMSLLAFSAFLIAPPIIGFLSDQLGLRVALLLLVPVAATTSLLAREISRN